MRSDKGLMIETSAIQSLSRWQLPSPTNSLHTSLSCYKGFDNNWDMLLRVIYQPSDGKWKAHGRGSPWQLHSSPSSPRPSINGPWQGPSLPGEVEIQVQVVKVEERPSGYRPDRALGHFSKHSISQLIEQGSSGPGSSIWLNNTQQQIQFHSQINK